MTTVSMPALGESVEEGTVLAWLKAVGDTVVAEEPLLEVATDKVDTEVPSPVSGTVRELLVEPGALVPVGGGIAVIDDGTEDSAVSTTPSANETSEPQESAAVAGSGSGFLSPLVRMLARRHGVQLDAITGSGAHGRITKRDVLAAIEASPTTSPVPDTPAPSTPVGPPSTEPAAPSRSPSTEPLRAGERREPMTRVRRAIASAMMSSLQTSAQLTTVVEVDLTHVVRARSQHKVSFQARTGTSLNYLPFFSAAAITALNAYPVINARVDGDDIVYSAPVHLGIAVDSDRGLFVPVVRNASDLSVQGLTRAIAEAAEKTRSNSLATDDLRGGTFTITNTGSRGALIDTPIINAPQSAILATGAVVDRPVVATMPDGTKSITIRPMAYLALSYDHRIIDGAVAAGYLVEVKNAVESDTWSQRLS